MGKTPARANPSYWNGTNKWVSISDLSGYDKYVTDTKECISDLGVSESGIKSVPKNTVIMSFKLSIGKTAITTEDVYTNEAIMAFIDKGVCEINTDYLYYLFSGTDWNKGTNKAVLGLTLNKATLSKKEIDIPDLHTQNEVVKKLDALSNVIQLQKLSLDKLDELIKSRFVEMFGDPVINPMCWERKPFLQIGSCKNGMNFHNDESGVNIHCLGVGNFKDLSTIQDTSVLPIISLNEMPSDEYMLQNNDIVFVRSNGNKALVGRCLTVYPYNIPTTFSGFCIRFRIENRSVAAPYLLRVLKSDSIRNKIKGRGANIQNLNQKILSKLEIPIPPMNLQNQFADFVTQVEKQKAIVQQSIDKLETLKKSLMQEYFG